MFGFDSFAALCTPAGSDGVNGVNGVVGGSDDDDEKTLFMAHLERTKRTQARVRA